MPPRGGALSLAETHPEVASMWRDLEYGPEDIVAGSTKYADWECVAGHLFRKQISQRVYAKSESAGCPECYRKIKHGFRARNGNNVATLYPDLATQWSPNNEFGPETYTSQSMEKVLWICPLDHEYRVRIGIRVSKGSGCPTCSGRGLKLTPEYNLSFLYPELMIEWDPQNYLDPSKMYPFSSSDAMWICKICDHHWVARIEKRANGQGCMQCLVHSANRWSSAGEKEIADIFVQLGFEVRRNIRGLIGRQEIDIIVPKLNLAIEFNGVYWHSEKYIDWEYHYGKYVSCREVGLQLLQIWEDDWNNHPRLIVRMLLDHLDMNEYLGVIINESVPVAVNPASCDTMNITTDEAAGFLNMHHLGVPISAPINIGLVLRSSGELIAMIAANELGETLHVERYATSRSVPDGFKMLCSSLQAISGASMTINDDLSWSNQEELLNSGWMPDTRMAPDYTYRLGAVRHPRYDMDRFRDDPDLMHKPGLSLTQLEDLNGMQRIYDSGHMRYTHSNIQIRGA